MSVYFWPEALPSAPSRRDFVHVAANNSLSQKVDIGPARTRRRTSANISKRQATYTLKERSNCPAGNEVNQKQIFLDFYEIVDTTISFWLPDPTNQSQYILVRIVAQGEDEGPAMTPIAPDVWALSLKLEVWPNAIRPRT